jgi:hypothetical protein
MPQSHRPIRMTLHFVNPRNSGKTMGTYKHRPVDFSPAPPCSRVRHRRDFGDQRSKPRGCGGAALFRVASEILHL